MPTVAGPLATRVYIYCSLATSTILFVSHLECPANTGCQVSNMLKHRNAALAGFRISKHRAGAEACGGKGVKEGRLSRHCVGTPGG